jgi:hypothetical protein
MGRAEANQAQKQSIAQSAQDQAAAQASLAGTNASLKKYSSDLDSFMKFGRDTYGAGGEYARDQNAIATGTAAAGSNAIKGNLALHTMATGENTGGYAGSVAESQRQSQRDLTSQLATADATRLQNLTSINQYGVDASKFPAEVQSNLYGTGVAGAAHIQPGGTNFWDQPGTQSAAASTAATVGTAIAAAV